MIGTDLHHEIVDIALVCLAATVCGLTMLRFRQPALVGYISAGILLGPSGLGLIETRQSIIMMAELGVTLLLFVIGMELSLRVFRAVYRVALATTALQIAFGLAAMYVMGQFFDWPANRVILLGFAVALSSTAVGIKILEDIGELRTGIGRITVGILIAQDLAVVPMLLIVNGLGRGEGLSLAVIFPILLAIGILAATVWFLSRRERVSMPFGRWITDNPGLMLIAALAICLLFSSITGALGLSTAFGAFLAGLIIGNSNDRVRIAEVILPLQDALLMVFFLSIGLLIDISFVVDNIVQVLILVFLVLVFKSAGNVLILRLLGQTWSRAFVPGFALGQIGEFSFILGAAGLAAGAVLPEAHRLLIAVITLSLMASPLWLGAARYIERVRLQRDTRRRRLQDRPAGGNDHVLISPVPYIGPN
jgi:CPA2 family monovalent cation:H+ antiporter-2